MRRNSVLAATAAELLRRLGDAPAGGMAAVQPQALPATALSEPAAGLLRRIEAAAKNTGDAASGSGKALPAPQTAESLSPAATRELLRRPGNWPAADTQTTARTPQSGQAARGGATGEVRTLPSASVPNAQRSLSEATYAAPVQPAAFSAETSDPGRTMEEISEFFRRDSRRYDNGFSGGNGR